MNKKNVDPLQTGGQIDKLEMLLLAKKVSRRHFIKFVTALGTSAIAASTMADKALAVSAVQADLRKDLKPHYDYIVCGAGAAGSAVARRLAENPDLQVLLLEAGGADDAPSIINPSLWPTNIGGKFDWGFRTEPHPALNNRSIPMPMGKAMGGGSSINATIWAHGHKNDYEYWARETGDEAWGYQHILSIYRRIEDWQGEPDPLRRGRGGVVYVEPASNPSPLAPAFVQGAASIGIPAYADQNGAMMEGIGGAAIANLCIKDGRRRNMPSDYLYPFMDKGNLTILTKARVNRLTLDGSAVTGVEVEWDGKVHHFIATREVVLSTGAINTPRILMLSGIGNAADLETLGIKSVSNLPGVGQNFQDHMLVAACMWEPPEAIPPRNSAAEATFFWKSDSRLDTPDLQPFHIEVPFVSNVNMPRAIPSGWVITPGIVRPKSRGYVRLMSNEPDGKMEIHANALDHPDDVAVLRRGIELCREIGNSEAMKPFVKREVMPGPLKGSELETFIRNSAVSYNHATCTAKMGRDEMSVVDAQLRVYGIQRLRIADGSIMPRITTGNTMAPSVIIGERLAEILKAS